LPDCDGMRRFLTKVGHKSGHSVRHHVTGWPSLRPRRSLIRLTTKEFDLLSYLAAHANKTVPHRELLQEVWGPDYGGEQEYLRVFVKRLRKKIEASPSSPQAFADGTVGRVPVGIAGVAPLQHK
jgi:DNA-binding response OmpR family regulator